MESYGIVNSFARGIGRNKGGGGGIVRSSSELAGRKGP